MTTPADACRARPIRAYQRVFSPALGERCRYYPSCSHLRGAGGGELRHTPRARPGRVARAALQSAESWRGRPGAGPASVQDPRPRGERLIMLINANIFQPLIDVFEAVLKFFHNSVGVPWGWSIVLLTVCRARAPDPADRQAVRIDAAHAATAAADEGDPGEVQGRQGAPAAGDDALLQGEQRQPAGLVPPAGRPDPGLHLALLHAAQEPARRHLPRPPARWSTA